MSSTRRGFLITLGTTSVIGCSGVSDDSPVHQPSPTPIDNDGTSTPTPDEETPTSGDEEWWPTEGSPTDASIEVEVLAENLEIPWDFAFASNGALFITERTGSVLRFEAGQIDEITRPADVIDAEALEPGSDEQRWWLQGGEAGMLGIDVHPSYPDPGYVYVYYTTETTDGFRNQVARYEFGDNPNPDGELIIDDIPGDTRHNGGRIAFGPDRNLWVLTGDADQPERTQDVDWIGGKVLRVQPDGEPVSDNPDLGNDADPRIFTYGHRNPQGIDWLPDGTPIITEHGPGQRDEINLLYSGGNYGWNDARGGPDDSNWSNYADHDEYIPPLINTGTDVTWAPSGATFYTGGLIPAWSNRFIVGGLVTQSVFVVTITPEDVDHPPLEGDSWRYDEPWMDDSFVATAHRLLHNELGRVRHLTEGPDGDLYAITSNRDGRVQDGPFPTDRDDVLVRLIDRG